MTDNYLINPQNVNVKLEEKKLKFFADGEGARGLNSYGFSIDFHSAIDPEVTMNFPNHSFLIIITMNLFHQMTTVYNTKIIDFQKSDYKIIERQIDFALYKKSSGRWPRLTGQPQKPPWLKIDFDKLTNDDVEDEEIEEVMRDICQDYPDMYDKLHKEEYGYRKGK